IIIDDPADAATLRSAAEILRFGGPGSLQIALGIVKALVSIGASTIPPIDPFNPFGSTSSTTLPATNRAPDQEIGMVTMPNGQTVPSSLPEELRQTIEKSNNCAKPDPDDEKKEKHGKYHLALSLGIINSPRIELGLRPLQRKKPSSTSGNNA